jgi:hypothetical protein
VADSAVTKSTPLTLPQSSFGETHPFTGEYYVEEGLLKIVQISNNFVVAFSGDVLMATEIIKFIKEHLRNNNDIILLFKSMVKSLGPFEKHRAVSLIIATTIGGHLDLVKWETEDSHNLLQGNEYLQIGSVQPFHGLMTQAILSLLAKGNLPIERMLPISTAIIQSFGIHHDMMSQFIGGMIYGLSIDSKNMLCWQEDTRYILYDPEFKDIGFITCLCRGDAVSIRSTITNDTRVLLHSSNSLRPNDWNDKWKELLISDYQSCSVKYWSFLSKKDHNITVVTLPVKSNGGKYFIMKYLGEGKYDFAINPKFVEMLTSPLLENGELSMPYRLTCVEG